MEPYYWKALAIAYGLATLLFAIASNYKLYTPRTNVLGGLLLWAVVGLSAVAMSKLVVEGLQWLG